jgi:hypothetical protein
VINDGRRHGGLFIGILITVIGVIFLLDQMEIVHAMWIFEIFWPVILIALGMTIILRTNDFRGNAVPNSSDTANPGQPNATQFSNNLPYARRATINFWGPVLILIGAVWLFSNITHFDAGRLWPLWMIAVGVWLLINRDYMRGYSSRAQRRAWRRYGRYGWPPSGGPGSGPASGSGPNPTSAGFADQATGSHDYWAGQRGGSGAGSPTPPNPPPPGAPSTGSEAGPSASFVGPGYVGPGYPPPADSVDDTFYRTVVFMGFNRRITSQHFRFGKVSAVFGGFNLDFRGAEMEGNQAVLQIEAVFGGGEIRIPPTWRVSVTAHEIAGAVVDETYAHPGAAAPAKVLIIHGTTVFGGVVIKN